MPGHTRAGVCSLRTTSFCACKLYPPSSCSITSCENCATTLQTCNVLLRAQQSPANLWINDEAMRLCALVFSRARFPPAKSKVPYSHGSWSCGRRLPRAHAAHPPAAHAAGAGHAREGSWHRRAEPRVGCGGNVAVGWPEFIDLRSIRGCGDSHPARRQRLGRRMECIHTSSGRPRRWMLAVVLCRSGWGESPRLLLAAARFWRQPSSTTHGGARGFGTSLCVRAQRA